MLIITRGTTEDTIFFLLGIGGVTTLLADVQIINALIADKPLFFIYIASIFRGAEAIAIDTLLIIFPVVTIGANMIFSIPIAFAFFEDFLANIATASIAMEHFNWIISGFISGFYFFHFAEGIFFGRHFNDWILI